MKTIFFEKNKLHISSNHKPGINPMFEKPNAEQLKFIISQFLTSRNYEALIVGDKDLVMKAIKKHFEHIKAAGGLVQNKDNKVLLIKRLGKWDLPKGKLEVGEPRRVGAIREVEEECGISGVRIVKKLKSSYHVYPYKNSWALKTSYWYLMKYDGEMPLIPQEEENITQAIWQDMNLYNTTEMETYPAIEKVLRQSLSLWE